MTLRASKDSNVVRKDVDKNEKQDGKSKSSQLSLRNKPSDDEARTGGPTPAERYLQQFIKDSQKRIKRQGFSEKAHMYDSSINHLLPKSQTGTGAGKKKVTKKKSDADLRTCPSQQSITSMQSTQNNSQAAFPSGISRSPKEKRLKEFQQKYMKKNTLSVLREESFTQETPHKMVESQTF